MPKSLVEACLQFAESCHVIPASNQDVQTYFGSETYNDSPRSHAHAAGFGTDRILSTMILSESPAHVGFNSSSNIKYCFEAAPVQM